MIDQVLALRRAALARHPDYDVDGAEAVASLRREIEEAMSDLQAERVLEGRATIALWRTTTPVEQDAQRGQIDIALGDEEAQRWAAEQLVSLREEIDASLELTVDAAHQTLIDNLGAAGLCARMAHLHGSANVALERLRAGELDRNALGDMRIEPLDPARHLDQVIAMLRDVFTEAPEFGYLPPGVTITPDVQARLDAFVGDNLVGAAEQGCAFVITHDGRVVGKCSARHRVDPLVGRVGGLSIALVPEIRGRGIGKLLYERLIARLVELDVVVMRGRSANPKVLRLAQRLGRTIRAWQVERRSG